MGTYLFSAQSCRMFLALLTPQHHHGLLFHLPITITLLSFQRQYKLSTPTPPLSLKLSGCAVCFSLPKRTFKIIFSRETDSTQLRVSEYFISPVYLTVAKPLLSEMQSTGRSFSLWVLQLPDNLSAKVLRCAGKIWEAWQNIAERQGKARKITDYIMFESESEEHF